MELTLFRDLGVALGLGLLIGLQREWADKKLAGIRTFPLITLLGALCGLLAQRLGGAWIPGAGLIAVAAVLLIGNTAPRPAGAPPPGATTEIAALLMFVVGAAVMAGLAPLAVVVTGVTAVLLHWKRPLHAFADRIGADDVQALVRLVLIGMVVLPLLPDRAFGPYDVLNPFKIWLMVVLIVGISLAAYAVQRFLGARAGTVLSGVLGGLISSTATTVSHARLTREGASAAAAALVIVIASTVVFGRVLFEIAVVAPGLLAQVAPPLAAMMAWMVVVSAATFWTSRADLGRSGEDEAPKDLKAAVIFGALYAGVLIAVAAVEDRFGHAALYGVAALSGLTDMDAITLSSAQLMKDGTVEVATGWRLILVGGMANLVFKAGAAAVLGTGELARRIVVPFGISLAGGAALLALWPR